MSESIEEYWSSEDGILIRLEDLAHEFTFKTYNRALKGYFQDSGIRKLRWVTSMDNLNRGVSCSICEGRNGKVYKSSQFLPRIPVHIGCGCFWDVEVQF